MISYELAKQLADNNFPYKRPVDSSVMAPIVSLEELIEACGEIVLWKNGDKWCADFFNGEGNRYIDDYFDAEEGSTPTEAVAKLWLALNKQ